MKICYVPSDLDAPGCYRCMFPARQLRRMGHTVTMPAYTQKFYGDVDDDGTQRTRISFQIKVNPPFPEADLWVLQQRKERMWSEEGVNQLRRWGVATVADVDDNYQELPTWNPAFYGTHPYRRDDGLIVNRKIRRGLKGHCGLAKVEPNMHNRLHMNDTFKRVDAMTVSTPYLANLYEHINPNITVIRNMLDWDIWDDLTPQYEVERERTRIGYLGVFTYRAGDLNVIRDVIPKFLRRHPEVDFVANSVETLDYLRVPDNQRVVVPQYSFRPPDGEQYKVGVKTAVLDIGLVPLELNGLNQGKSHLKGMEYNGAGVPFIASPTESYESYWCDSGQNGFLAYNEREWDSHLEILVTNDALRRKMGRLGRLKASENTIQKRGVEWESYYKGILGDDATKISRQSISVGAVQKVSECAAMLRHAEGAKVIVEIGSARGGTYWALARVADEEALLASLDMVAGSPIDVRNGKDVYNGRPTRERMAKFVLPRQTAVMIDGNSQLPETRKILEDHLQGREIDFLFIDGDHRYQGVKADHDLYAPLVRSGGKIAFHDMIPQNDTRSGVHVLWEELIRQYAEWYEYVGDDNWGLGSWGGIGVVVKP